MSIFAVLLASQLVIPVADRAPRFDFEPGCRATIGDGIGTLQSCEDDEKTAREQVAKQWNQFSGPDRSMCTEMTQTKHPSYVELLSCLEMMRDAKMPTSDQSPDAKMPTSDQSLPGTSIDSSGKPSPGAPKTSVRTQKRSMRAQ
jgi:hypothetical protein